MRHARRLVGRQPGRRHGGAGNGAALAFLAGGTYSHAITMVGSSTLNVASGQTVTQGTAIGDGGSAGGLVKAGTGTLILSGTNTYTGGTMVTAGLLQLSGGATLGSTSAATTVAGGTLDLGGSTQTQNGGFTPVGRHIAERHAVVVGDLRAVVGRGQRGAGRQRGMVKSGTGTVVMTGVNTYTGGTTVTGGLINFASAGNFGSGRVTLNGGGLQWAAGNTTDISTRLSPPRRGRRHVRHQRQQRQPVDGDHRHRRADQGGLGHADPQRREHLCRRHDDQRRRAAAGSQLLVARQWRPPHQRRLVSASEATM